MGNILKVLNNHAAILKILQFAGYNYNITITILIAYNIVNSTVCG